MSANDELFDAQLRHAIAVRRFGGGEAKAMLAILDDAEVELQSALLRRLRPGSDFTSDRNKALMADIRGMRREVVATMRGQNRDSLVEFAKAEQEFNKAMLDQTVPVRLEYAVVNAETLRALVTHAPFDAGTNVARTLGQWWDKLSIADQQNIHGAIQKGMTLSEPIPRIIQRVTMATDISRRGAEAVVRTAVNHVSNTTRGTFMAENEDVIQCERWTSTLDGRTTAVCRARDGHYAPVGDNPCPEPRLVPPEERPPAHVSCRSVMVAVLYGEGIARVMGERPFVRDTRTRRLREIDFRAEAKEKAGKAKWSNMDAKQRNNSIARMRKDWAKENIGQVPAGTTYDAWLRRQPREFQNEVLGVQKGIAFRKGLKLDQYVDRAGNELTLDQLRAKYPEFISAN